MYCSIQVRVLYGVGWLEKEFHSYLRTYPPVHVPCTMDYVYVYRLSNACSLPLYLILVRHWPCFLNVIKFSRLLKRHRGLVFFYIFENLYILTGWYRIDDKPKLCHHRTRATYVPLLIFFRCRVGLFLIVFMVLMVLPATAETEYSTVDLPYSQRRIKNMYRCGVFSLFR